MEDDYEARRAATIKHNQALIASLGLAKPASPAKKRSAAPSSSEDAPDFRPKKAKRASGIAKTPLEPTRRSTRLVETASKEELSSLPDDFSDSEVNSSRRRAAAARNGSIVPRIRQLPAPELPELDEQETIEYDPDYRAPLPSRDEGNSGFGRLRFEDTPHFAPNLHPSEVMRFGSFGGTYWREFYSRTLKQTMPDTEFEEFPAEWYEGIDRETYLTSQDYDPEINKYGVKASQSIEEWEKAGWIRSIDPRGWMQWYCRFYQGRRTPDDERQIRRYLSAVGPRGRFKTSLVKKIAGAGGADSWDDPDIAPILRQTLQHWGVRITREDMLEYLDG